MAHWESRVVGAIHNLSKSGRKYRPDDLLSVIDGVIAGKTYPELLREFGRDVVVTAVGHVTTATQGGGSVTALRAGGWYERNADGYVVNSDFARAWREQRPGK